MSRFFNLSPIMNNSTMLYLYASVSRIVFIFLFIAWLKSVKTKNDFILFAVLISYFLFLSFSTILGFGDIRGLTGYIYPLLGTYFFICVASRKNYFTLIKAYTIMLYILVIINFFDMILFKDLSTQYSTNFFFIGGKNQLGITFTLGFCFISYYVNSVKKLKNIIFYYIYFFLIITTAILTKSGTTILTIFILIIGILIKSDKIIAPIKFLFSYLLFLILIIYFKIQNYFMFLLVDILHKDITFTGRTNIWDKAVEEIKNSPILGHGLRADNNYFIIENIHGSYALSAHNEILHLLYEGGFISLLLFIVIFVICCRHMREETTFKLYFIGVISIFVTWFAEAPGVYGMFLILFFCFYMPKANGIYQNEERRN